MSFESGWPSNPYFGPRWGGTGDARQVPTPVGEPCIGCGVPVVEGDQGFLQTASSLDGCGGWRTRVVPHHRECQLASTSGHLVGVCSCCRDRDVVQTPEQIRADGLEAWRRFGAREFKD